MLRKIALLLGLALPATSLAAADLIGLWSSTLDGLTLSMNADGSFGISPPDRPALSGSWRIDADSGLYIFANDTGSAVCPGIEGRYRLIGNGSKGVLHFAHVNDECTPRLTHMRSEFVRQD